MKRADPIRQIRREAKRQGVPFEQVRAQGGQDVFSLGGVRIVVARHREIPEGTADSIRRRAEGKPRKGWWR